MGGLSPMTLRTDFDDQIRSNAVSTLASILDPEANLSAEAATGDRLFEAVAAAGRAAHIPFKIPPRWEAEALGSDPIASICRSSSVRSRRVLLRGEWWRDDNGPLLGFMRSEDPRADPWDHPVALLPSGRLQAARYTVFDPADGSRTPVDETVSDRLDSFGVMFYKPLPARRLTIVDLLLHGRERLFADYAVVLLISIAGGLLGVALPFAIGLVFTEVIPNSDEIMLSHLIYGLLVATVATNLFELTQSIALLRIDGIWGSTVQSSVWDRLVNLPVTFFRKFTVGDLAERADAIDEIRQDVSGTVLQTILAGIISSFQFILLFYYSGRLALVAVFLALCFTLATLLLGGLSLRYERRLQELTGRLSGLLFQIISGIAKLRVAGAESRAFAVWAERFRDERRIAFQAGLFQTHVIAVNSLIPVITAIVIYGSLDFLWKDSDGITVGAFIGFNAALAIFLSSMLALSDTVIRMLDMIPTIQRVTPILDETPESSVLMPDPGKITGRIEVNNVSFKYDPLGPRILDQVSWVANPGEFIAFVGPSGSGKSTLLRLLLGFEKAEIGNIYFEGQDINAVDVVAIRRQLGVVLQSSKLRSGTILDNIVGSSLLSLEDAWRAAEMAGVAGDISRMPMGMQTMILEGGSTLSGGQRQRILISRALAKNPRVVIFDEATSALDNETQQVVTESLARLNMTRIVIAHRLSTIQNANRIYVMERGKIIQSGTYDELAGIDGMFLKLIRRQTV